MLRPVAAPRQLQTLLQGALGSKWHLGGVQVCARKPKTWSACTFSGVASTHSNRVRPHFSSQPVYGAIYMGDCGARWGQNARATPMLLIHTRRSIQQGANSQRHSSSSSLSSSSSSTRTWSWDSSLLTVAFVAGLGFLYSTLFGIEHASSEAANGGNGQRLTLEETREAIQKRLDRYSPAMAKSLLKWECREVNFEHRSKRRTSVQDVHGLQGAPTDCVT